MNAAKVSPLKAARQKAYREVILEVSEEIFADYGYDAARVQTIAEKAGVSVGTIYGVFGSKSELFSVVLTSRLPDLLELTTKTAADAPNSLSRLVDGLEAYLIYVLEHPNYLRIHLREHAWGLGPTRASEGQLTAWRQGLELMKAVLQEAMDDGHIIIEDPERLARSITAVHQVHLQDWVDKGQSDTPAEVAARLRKLFIQMFCVDRSTT